MDPTLRFSDRTGDYARHRPHYPPAAVDAIADGVPRGSPAADIGAGTGISTRLLLERGFRVSAVEPNRAMREAGQAETAAWLAERPGCPSVHWLDATGERTTLDDASQSLVLCAQSLHWLDPAAAVTEFARVLTRGGVACAVWNVHDTRDAAISAYREIVVRHAVDPPRSPWFRNNDCALGTAAARAAGLDRYAVSTFDNAQDLDEAGLIGRAVSSSYLPREGPARAALESDLQGLFRRYARSGVLTFRYVCEVHRAWRR